MATATRSPNAGGDVLPVRVIVAIELVGGARNRAVCRTGRCRWAGRSWSWLAFAQHDQGVHRADHLSGRC